MPGKPPGPNGDFEGPKTESDGPKMPFGLPVSIGKVLRWVKMVKKEKVPGRVLKAGGSSRNGVVALWK